MLPLDPEKIWYLFRYDPSAPLLFSSGLFLFLFLGFSAIYFGLRRADRARILWSLGFSLFFYYKSSGMFLLLLLASVLVDFYAARWIARTDFRPRRKALLVLSLVANLGMLAYFKYTNYALDLCAAATGAAPVHLDIFLPVGISFFTFQSMSYTIDVYRGQLKPLNSLADFAFYVTFFPQMVAGPIVRAADFLPQIHRPLLVTREQFGRGVFLLATGLFKKAVISDYISLNFVDRVFDSPLQYSGLENLAAVYGYALQIYCDFSGYSDMAIGIGLLLGFTFPANFNAPYQSLSITEFWRRWHISLSTWLRDYLYIPLGGNRKGPWRNYLNLMLTMLLGGLWHGAATRFILWGGLHGLALAAERWFKTAFPRAPGVARQTWGGILTFHFVCFCWIFFRAQDMQTAGQVLSQMAFHFDPAVCLPFINGYAPVVFWMALGYALHFLPPQVDAQAEKLVTRMPLVFKAVLLVLVIVLVVQVKSSEVQPFIYFQF